MAKKQKRIIGSILKVPLNDGTHTYAQTLPEADFVIFDARSTSNLDPDEIVNRPILFRVAVHKSAWCDGRWERIGKSELNEQLIEADPKFIQDSINPEKFQIYLAGEIRNATKEECLGLECCAVWEPEHVEDRIRDHYAGVPNVWLESLKIK